MNDGILTGSQKIRICCIGFFAYANIIILLNVIPSWAFAFVSQPEERILLAQYTEGTYSILVNPSCTTQELIGALEKSTLKHQRRYAAQLLGDRKEPQAVDALIKALRDPEEIVQKAAAESLGRIGDRSIFSDLVDNLNSPRPFVREYSAYVLGRLADKGDKNVVEALERAAEDEETNVRIEVIYALYEIGSVSSKDIFIKGLSDEEPRIRSYSATALANLRVGEAGPALSSALERETDENVMRVIISSLGRVGGTGSVAILSGVIAENNVSLKADIADALAEIKTPEATSALIDLLSDSSAKVRSRAANALIGVKDPAATEALANALKDRAAIVRRPASEALIEVADSSIINDLVQALGDTDATVADNAAKALVRMNDLDAVHALMEVIESPNSSQVERAIEVLEEITHRPYGTDVGKWIQWYNENFKTSS